MDIAVKGSGEMRLINADELLTAFPIDAEPTLTKSCVRMTIQRMPTVDAVPVVRCRDCKRYQHEVGDDEYALGWCPFLTIHLVSRNGFCAWGKRKEDGNAADE